MSLLNSMFLILDIWVKLQIKQFGMTILVINVYGPYEGRKFYGNTFSLLIMCTMEELL